MNLFIIVKITNKKKFSLYSSTVIMMVLIFYYEYTKQDMIRYSRRAQGPVVQSIVSLTSPLVVKILTVLVGTISNSQVFLLKKCE